MLQRFGVTTWVAVTMLALSGCQLAAPRAGGATVNSGDAVARLETALAGDYDNDEQVRQARAGVRAGTQVAVPHLREQWRLLQHDRDHDLWLWHWLSQDPSSVASVDWLYRVAPATDGNRIVLTPYRAI